MRDPKRIPKMLGAFRDVWEEHPDLRLGQLIMIALGSQKPMPTKEYFKMIKEKTGISISTQVLLDVRHGYLITPIHSGDIFGVPDEKMLNEIKELKKRISHYARKKP